MKHFMLIIKTSVLIFLSFVYLSYGTVDADIKVLNETSGGFSLSYRPSAAIMDTIFHSDKLYVNFSYDNHFCRMPVGAPAIPLKSVFFASPKDVVPSIELVNISKSVISDVPVIPVPYIESDRRGFSFEVFKEDPAYYALSGFRPRNFDELGNRTDNGDITVWELILNPVLYDARMLKAAVADSFDINISFGGKSINADSQMKRIPDYIINRKIFEHFGSKKPAALIENPFASGDWYRIELDAGGMYILTSGELASAGFPVGTVYSNDIRMYYGGGKIIEEKIHDVTTDDFREISIKIIDGDDSVFGTGDEIVFYGEAISRFLLVPGNPRPEFQNHPYSEKNVYWLTISNTGIPKRINFTGEAPSEEIEKETSYRYIKHIEQENMLELIEGGIEWYWDAISNNTKKFLFNAPGNISGYPVNIRIGFINQLFMRPYNIEIFLNNERSSVHSFPIREKGNIDITSSIKPKTYNNIINISLINSSSTDFIHLDWIEVEYERTLSLINNNLVFFKTGENVYGSTKFAISNVNSSDIEIYDTTDSFNVMQNTYSQYDSQNNTLTFQETIPVNQTSRFSLWKAGSFLKVSSISKKRRTNLRNVNNEANYFIITRPMFYEEAIRLAEWRLNDSQIDPLLPMVVNVEDIYDEFNWGIFDPIAVRDFLKFVWENGDPNQKYYCCFFGDTITKYKNLSDTQKERVLVTTFSDLDYGPDDKLYVTDDFFSWFDNNKIPAFAMGRLCANDKDTASNLVDKIIEYERNPEPGMWHNRVLFIADDELGPPGIVNETVHTRNSEKLLDPKYIPSYFERRKIYQIEYPLKNFRKPDVTEAVISAFHEGYIIVNFIGHGNSDVLAHEHIIEGARDIDRFNNRDRLPLLCVLSCSVAKFYMLDNVSLGEFFHLRKNGGCIGVIAAIGNTYSSNNQSLNKSLYQNLFNREINPEHRIGYALQLGKKDIPVRNSTQYILLGDPATRLMIPRYRFSIAETDTIFRLQKLDLSGNIHDGLDPVPFNGTLYIKALGPKISKAYKMQNNKLINYTKNGNPFFFGEYSITGDGFNASFVVPIDIPSYSKDLFIHFFATGQDHEATGVFDNFVIGGRYKDAPDDNEGPTVSLKFDNNIFEDGGFISSQPVMEVTITDPSGINIYGNRGKNVTLFIDKSEIIILTDYLKAINSFTNSVLEYTLPILTPGEHKLELSVYDTYNNSSKKSVTVHVLGSEAGDISIYNLLNYPNPMDSKGTTFTFSLTDKTRNADIKIYSQSGRLVDTIKFIAIFGYNQISWKPQISLANGVYFYKLSIRSMNGRKSSKIEKLVVMK